MQINSYLNSKNTCFTARLHNRNNTFRLMHKHVLDSGLKDEFKVYRKKLEKLDKKEIYITGWSNKKPYPCVRLFVQIKEKGKPLKKICEHIDSTTTDIGKAAYGVLKELTDDSSKIFKKVF